MIVLFALVLAALSASGKVIFTKPGESVTLECGVGDSNNVRWNHENVLVISLSRSFPTKGDTPMKTRCFLKEANLVVKQVTEADAGTFTCTAGGHTQEVILVVFSVGVDPSHYPQVDGKAELHCKAKPDGVGVQWQGPDGKVHPASAKVSLDPVGRQNAGTWKCTLSHSSDTHTESLEVTVKERRPTTPSPPSIIPGNVGVSPGGVEPVDPVSPHGTTLLGIPLWMWAVIGGGGLVVVLLAILVACMCRRVRRKRRIARKMKNGLQLRTPPQYCQCDRPTAAAKPQQRRQRAKPSPPPLQSLLVE
ncbi:CD4-2 molecule, tandem duplicate 1 [Nelusetta ayraudi]|uniref:CD4-2 molecule, tandem duplicate 1 n=1 Tax=Nelusetta ayraudi TaxID=303726 RepID=UPI003F72087E